MKINPTSHFSKFLKTPQIEWDEIFNLQTVAIVIIFGLAISIVSLLPLILFPQEVTNVPSSGLVLSIYKVTIPVSSGLFLLTTITYVSGIYSQILAQVIWLFLITKSLLLTGYENWRITQEPPKERLVQVDVVKPEPNFKSSEFDKKLLRGIWIVQPTLKTEAFNYQLYPLPPTQLA